MAVAPFLSVPDEFTDTMPGGMSSSVVSEDGAGGVVMADLGGAHKPLLITIVGLVLLKFATELEAANLPLAEVRVTVLNWVIVTAMAVLGLTALKLLNAFLLRRGIVVPGFADFIGAL